jgi:hypothetical protein
MLYLKCFTVEPPWTRRLDRIGRLSNKSARRWRFLSQIAQRQVRCNMP